MRAGAGILRTWVLSCARRAARPRCCRSRSEGASACSSSPKGRPNCLDLIKNGEVQLIINTPAGKTPRVDEVQDPHGGGGAQDFDHDHAGRGEAAVLGHQGDARQRSERPHAAAVPPEEIVVRDAPSAFPKLPRYFIISCTVGVIASAQI